MTTEQEGATTTDDRITSNCGTQYRKHNGKMAFMFVNVLMWGFAPHSSDVAAMFCLVSGTGG